MDTGNIIDLARERRRRGPRFDGGLMDILEISRDLVCLCRAGHITAINGAGVRLLGASSTAELLDRRLTDFLVPEYASVVALFLAGKASEDKAVPTRLLGLDGTARDVEMQVYRAREISPDATVIVCRDLSRRDKATGRTADTEARLLMLVENAMNLVCHVADGRIRYINRAGVRMLGAAAADAVAGLCVTAIFDDQHAAVLAAGVPESLGTAGGVPMRLKRLDGAPVEVVVVVSRLPSDDGVELMVEARDVTAHDRAVTALRAANAALEARLADCARELAELRQQADAEAAPAMPRPETG